MNYLFSNDAALSYNRRQRAANNTAPDFRASRAAGEDELAESPEPVQLLLALGRFSAQTCIPNPGIRWIYRSDRRPACLVPTQV